jgi:hypothetical protein
MVRKARPLLLDGGRKLLTGGTREGILVAEHIAGLPVVPIDSVGGRSSSMSAPRPHC